MSTDGVTTAFDVILEELIAVVSEVNAQGAQFMKEGIEPQLVRRG